MKVVKKHIILILFLVGMAFMSTSVDASLSSDVIMSTSKEEYVNTDTVKVSVSFSNLKTENGVVAISGILKYDSNSLKLVDLVGKNEWGNPSYNDQNGKFIMDTNHLTTEDTEFLELTFKILKIGNTDINLENLTIANGIDKPVIIGTLNEKIYIKENVTNTGNESNIEDDNIKDDIVGDNNISNDKENNSVIDQDDKSNKDEVTSTISSEFKEIKKDSSNMNFIAIGIIVVAVIIIFAILILKNKIKDK